MTLEETLRWCLLGALLAVFPVVAYHRIKAHRAGGALDRRQEGWLFILATLRPIGLVFFVSQWHRFGQQQARRGRAEGRDSNNEDETLCHLRYVP